MAGRVLKGTASPSGGDPVRDRIVAAADALYYARGIHAVGIDEVRAAAGVSLKRLYGLFAGKEALVLAVLRRRHELWERGVEAAIAQAGDPKAGLLAIYDYLAEWFAEDSFRGCGFINAFGELGPSYPSVAEYARQHKDSFQARVGELVAQAGAPRGLAPQLALLAEGAQTTAAIAGTPEPAIHARAAAETLINAATA